MLTGVFVYFSDFVVTDVIIKREMSHVSVERQGVIIFTLVGRPAQLVRFVYVERSIKTKKNYVLRHMKGQISRCITDWQELCRWAILYIPARTSDSCKNYLTARVLS